MNKKKKRKRVQSEQPATLVEKPEMLQPHPNHDQSPFSTVLLLCAQLKTHRWWLVR
jgi:hypothetical protein